MSNDLDKDKPETLTLTIEFPRGVKLTQAQKEFIREEAARHMGAIIRTMTFDGQNSVDELNNEHKTRGNDEQK